jgi:predicted transcriptional regulator
MIEVTEEQKTWKYRLVKIGAKQSDFAKTIGITKSLMSNYLNCKFEPKLKRFNKIKEELQKLEGIE